MLTERDVELLRLLCQYRYLSLGQIERLLFHSAQTAARRVRLLAARGYVSVFRVPGVTDRLVAMDEAGLAVLANDLGVAKAELGPARRTQPKDYLFAKHFLAINDVRIALTRACEDRNDVDLLGFLADAICRRTPDGGLEKYLRDRAADVERPGGTLTHIPDAAFALARNGKAALFFLEVDRGTETIAHPDRGFLKALRFYLGYLAGDAYQRYRDDFRIGLPFKAFRTVIVTSSARRLENIRAASAALPATNAKRFIWLAEAAAVNERTVLDPIWVSLDPEDARRYAIAPPSGASEAAT